MTSTDHILRLVQRALDEFDDKPLDVVARRTVRIAVLMGEEKLAVRLSLELKPMRGHAPANAADTRRMLNDPSTWGHPDGAVEQAMTEYLEEHRRPNDDKVTAYSIAELAYWEPRAAEIDPTEMTGSQWTEKIETELHHLAIQERTRHHCFAALCSWERQLTYSNMNARIFGGFQHRVDAMLAAGAPTVLDAFNAVYRRLRDAVAGDGSVTEELAQAVVSCRRILKAVADHVYPPVSGQVSDRGVELDDEHYRARLREFVKANIDSDSLAEAVTADINGIYDRFAATDKLANKGLHASVALEEAELCAISTYITSGEILRLARLTAAST